MLKLTNCAMVDDKTETPGRITNHWKVWHEDTQQMRIFGDTDPILKMPKGLIFKQEMRPIDKLEVQSVVGFEVSGIQRNGHIHQIASLLLRHPTLYFGRPVYEAENGGQYLYWQATEAPAYSGIADSSMSGPGQVSYHEEVHKQTGGWWCFSSQVGARPEDPRCEACINENCMTPDQIKNSSTWLVRDANREPVLPEKRHIPEEEFNAKMHSPVSNGQIIIVHIDKFDGRISSGEDFAVDLLDVQGNVVLRFGLHMRHHQIHFNSFDSKEQTWGEREQIPVPEAFISQTNMPKPIPPIRFHNKDEGWEIRMGDAEEVFNYTHRETLTVTHDGEAESTKVIAPVVAIKASENCENVKILTQLYEDGDKEAWKQAFNENKLMKLKMEFWSHDTQTGLGLLDGDLPMVSNAPALLDAANAASAAANSGVARVLEIGGSASSEDNPG